MKIQYFKDISFFSPLENILFDEVLLNLAEEGFLGETLRFWESAQPFIVLGRIGKLREEIHLEVVQADRIPVLRRSSGGGTVLQGQGCLNYTLILSKESDPLLGDVRKSYQIILNKVIDIFKSLNIEVSFRSTSDLVLENEERKFSGNAQRRGKKFILHHGTFLYDFHLPLMGKYLKIPKKIPPYRLGRSHNDFLINLNVSPARIKQAFQHYFQIEKVDSILGEREEQSLKEFLTKKSVKSSTNVAED